MILGSIAGSIAYYVATRLTRIEKRIKSDSGMGAKVFEQKIYR
jgi:hypothetical protein